MGFSEHDPDQRPPQVDLHGLRPSEAQRRLERELHAARVRGAGTLVVITGAGHGNRRGEPVLRNLIEAWLGTPEARGRGVLGFRRAPHGGSLDVTLLAPATRRDGGYDPAP